MASEEHIKLAQYVKEVHASLRKSFIKSGAHAWKEHCLNREVLEKYAKSMEKLATQHWEANCSDEAKAATSRIVWAVQMCQEYFHKNLYEIYRKKEQVIATKLNLEFLSKENFSRPLKLLDVGSCYNPFRIYEFLDVLAIDLCPANNSVYQCDFLNVDVKENLVILKNKIKELKKSSFEVITFCFLLEYIPSSELRVSACEKAYDLLKPGGLLIINTPDSKHVGANCMIMKCWRYTLALMGFTRIKYEKFTHMHCMAFRKALMKDTAVRWANIHRETYMEYRLAIPQDSFQEDCETDSNNVDNNEKVELSKEDFVEMPFCNDFIS